MIRHILILLIHGVRENTNFSPLGWIFVAVRKMIEKVKLKYANHGQRLLHHPYLIRI